jgi:hypothetical protein
VSKKGSPVNVEQSKILKLLGHKLAKFKLTVAARWEKKGGKIKDFTK